MRKFYDENGKWIRSVAVPFEDIPEDYMVRKITLPAMQDLSYFGFMRELSEHSADFKEMLKGNEEEIGVDILSHLAHDYLQSAIQLNFKIIEDRNGPDLIVSYYVIPCLFCCRHAIELKLNQCLFVVNHEKSNNHTIIDLWKKITSKQIGNEITYLNGFIAEINAMDENEIVMRYGLDKNLRLLKEKYMIDIDAWISNIKYLFNVLAVECSCF